MIIILYLFCTSDRRTIGFDSFHQFLQIPLCDISWTMKWNCEKVYAKKAASFFALVARIVTVLSLMLVIWHEFYDSIRFNIIGICSFLFLQPKSCHIATCFKWQYLHVCSIFHVAGDLIFLLLFQNLRLSHFLTANANPVFSALIFR